MEDRVVFRVDSSPTFGTPVFALAYRAFPQRPPWYRRWGAVILRILRRVW